MQFRIKDYIIIFFIAYLFYVLSALKLNVDILLGSAFISVVISAILGTLTNLVFRFKKREK